MQDLFSILDIIFNYLTVCLMGGNYTVGVRPYTPICDRKKFR
jgi:hypothetical protein